MNKTNTDSNKDKIINSANLHIHSKFSDGAFRPRAIVEIAMQNELEIISITDHDSVEAYKHLPTHHLSLKIIPGIEFSSTWEDSDVHVLGYGIDVNDRDLLSVLAWMKNGRHIRAEKMLEKLSLLGIKIPIERVLSFAGDMKLIVRPHIAQALVAGNHCRSKQEAFDRFIGNDAPAYVPKPILSTTEVINYIHNAGGLAVIAHPGKLKSMTLIDDFVKQNVDGLEVWHPDHNEILRSELAEYCINNKLLQTGGSDFHGEEEFTGFIYSIPGSEEIYRDIQLIWDKYKWKVN